MRSLLIGLLVGSLLAASASPAAAARSDPAGVSRGSVVGWSESTSVARAVRWSASGYRAAVGLSGSESRPTAVGRRDSVVDRNAHAVVSPGRTGASSGAARAQAPPVVQPAGEFGWPLPGFPAVLRPFEAPSQPYGPGHRGVDLGGVVDSPVLAAGTGVVVFTGMVAGRPVVSIDHPSGLRTTYEPVVASVRAGATVARDSEIGRLQAGHDGCAATACLHWGVRRGEEYLDPLRLVVPGRVRLLPLDG